MTRSERERERERERRKEERKREREERESHFPMGIAFQQEGPDQVRKDHKQKVIVRNAWA